MNVEYEDLFSIAESCMAASGCVEEVRIDIMQDAIDCGEPDLAIIDALDIVGNDMTRLPHFPPQVLDLTNDPEWPEFHRFRDTLKKVVFN